MDLRDVLSTVLRRWYLTIPLLILALTGSVGVWQRVGTVYGVTGSMVLIPPPAVVEAQQASQAGYAPRNPLFYLGGLNYARDIIVTSVSSESFADEMYLKHRAVVTLSAPTNSGAPILEIDVSSPSAQGAVQAKADVLQQVPQRTEALQEGLGIARQDRLTLMTLSGNSTPTADHKKQVEFSVAVFVVLLAAGGLGVAVLDTRGSRTGSHPRVSRPWRRSHSGPGVAVHRRARVGVGPRRRTRALGTTSGWSKGILWSKRRGPRARSTTRQRRDAATRASSDASDSSAATGETRRRRDGAERLRRRDDGSPLTRPISPGRLHRGAGHAPGHPHLLLVAVGTSASQYSWQP